jgi:hypothetical protein
MVLEDWRYGLSVKLPEREIPQIISNWRGITLLLVSSRVLSTVIYENRINQLCREKITETAGRVSKWSIEQFTVRVLRIIVEHSIVWSMLPACNWCLWISRKPMALYTEVKCVTPPRARVLQYTFSTLLRKALTIFFNNGNGIQPSK